MFGNFNIFFGFPKSLQDVQDNLCGLRPAAADPQRKELAGQQAWGPRAFKTSVSFLSIGFVVCTCGLLGALFEPLGALVRPLVAFLGFLGALWGALGALSRPLVVRAKDQGQGPRIKV